MASSRIPLVASLGCSALILLAMMAGCGSDEPGIVNGELPEQDAGGVGNGIGNGVTNNSGSGNAGSNGGGGGSTRLGQACLDDAECGGGDLFCLTSGSNDYLGGGPPNGMCVASCSDDAPEACQEVDPNSACLLDDQGEGFCMPLCQIGDGDPNKCQGRADLACVSLQDQQDPSIGFCSPTCGSDLDCGERACDLGAGVCVDSAPSGAALGAECENDDECATGICVQFGPESEDPSVCSAGCVLGSLGCGSDPTSSEPLPGACLFQTSAEASVGDFGICGQLCTCNDDCLHPGLVCEPVMGLAADTNGRQGICDVPELPDGTVSTGIPCDGTDGGASGADAGSDSGASPADGGGPTTDASPESDAGGGVQPDAGPADAATD